MALEFFASELPDVRLNKIELNGGPGKNHDKFMAALNECGFESTGIPLIIAGGKCFQGFGPDTGREIKHAIGGK